MDKTITQMCIRDRGGDSRVLVIASLAGEVSQ